MSDAIIVALIAGICSVFGQWLVSKGQERKRKVDEAVRDARFEDRLSNVEEKLDAHNGYAARFSEIATDIAVIKNDIKTLYNRR